jgi:hypothetical protein
MIFSEHIELTLGIVVIALDDYAGGTDGHGNADGSRHDAWQELPEFGENPCHKVNPIARLRSSAPQLLDDLFARYFLPQATPRETPKVLSEVKSGR